MDSVFEFNIKQVSRIVLESLYIIGTSKNIETIKGRYTLLLKHFETLRYGQDKSDYFTTIVDVIESHNKTFPNAPLQKYQLEAISDPKAFNLLDFYCGSLIRATIDFYQDEAVKINTLKTNNAKIKRIESLINTLDNFKKEYEDKRPDNTIAIQFIESQKEVLKKALKSDN